MEKMFGPESKCAICLRALCQRFCHITVSTRSLWSRRGCSWNGCPKRTRRKGRKNSGWRPWDAISALWGAFDVNQGVCVLQQPCPLLFEVVLFLGALLCRDQPLQKKRKPSFIQCWRWKPCNRPLQWDDVGWESHVGVQMLTAYCTACNCHCHCMLAVRWCCGLSAIFCANVISLTEREHKFAYGQTNIHPQLHVLHNVVIFTSISIIFSPLLPRHHSPKRGRHELCSLTVQRGNQRGNLVRGRLHIYHHQWQQSPWKYSS